MVKRKDQGRKRLISIHQILVGLGSTGSYVLAPWLLKGWGRAGRAGLGLRTGFLRIGPALLASGAAWIVDKLWCV